MNLEQTKAALLATRADLEARLARTHRHFHHRDTPVSPDFQEQAKETENDAVVRNVEAEAQEELRLVNHALQRLDSGHYLNCSRCGSMIGEARLKALPYAEHCIRCATVR